MTITGYVRSLTARFFSLLVLAGLISLGIAPLIGLTSTASAAPSDDATNKLAVDLASPAVVRIISNVSGKVTCIACTSDGHDIVFPLNGGTYNLQFSGLGAFIAPDGYILTADHVVDYSNDQAVIMDFLNSAIKEAAQTFNTTTGNMIAIFNELIKENKVTVPTQVTSQRAFLSTAYTGQLTNPAQVEGFDVTRIVAKSPVNKQDVAIVKVEAHDMPFLKLATANEIKVQDTVTALAHPGNADTGDFATLFDPTSSDVNTVNGLLSVSVDTGQVTAQKKLSDGTLVYEISGISSVGSSGAPALDEKGAIIGFVDANPTNDPTTLLVPGGSVASYVQQAGISKPAGAFMNQWTKAITEFDTTGACHFTNAVSDFKRLQTGYPNFGGVRPFLKDAQAKATPSECPAPSLLSRVGGLLALGLSALALIAVVVVAIMVLRRRSSQPQLTPAGVPTAPYGYGAALPTPYPTPPAQPQQPEAQQPITPYPTTLAPAPAQQAAMPAPRACANGHPVAEPMATFCPQCGAPVNPLPQQQQA
jgi:Trypsin-like peptidase domain